MYVSPGEAAKHYSVTTNTIRLWADTGKIKYIKTSGGHRRYLIEDKIKDINIKRRKIIYCRVSSKKQVRDLERQVGYLRSKYPDYEVITDIGSGINFKRPGFLQIMAALIDGYIEKVVVAYRDRWSRIGFELFEWLFSRYEASIESIDTEIKNPEKELSRDLMEIITVYTARYYGLRKYNDENIDSENISESGSEDDV